MNSTAVGVKRCVALLGKTQQLRMVPSSVPLVVSKRFFSPTIISGMPRARVSMPEKLFHGFILLVGILATPAWVLGHLHDYKGQGKTDEE